MNITTSPENDNPARLAELLRQFARMTPGAVLWSLERETDDGLADYMAECLSNKRPFIGLVYAIMGRLHHLEVLPVLVDDQPLGGLTKQQATALRFIRNFIKRTGFSPSYGEIAGALHLQSKSNVKAILDGLEERGFLEVGEGHGRAVKITTAGARVNLGDSDREPERSIDNQAQPAAPKQGSKSMAKPKDKKGGRKGR